MSGRPLFRAVVRGGSAIRVAISARGKRVGVWYGARGVWERVILPGMRERATVEVVEFR